MGSDKLKYRIRYAKKGDMEQILKLVNDESSRTGALLQLQSSTLEGWISKKMSLVVETKENGESVIIGHEAANVWPKSGWIELRSSIVRPEYRGIGISGRLATKLVTLVKKRYPNATIIAFTNKAGSGKGIILSLGFGEAQYNDLPSELFTIGPAHRGKSEHGYKVFVKYP